MKKTILLTLTVIAAIALNGCTKDGPAGPQGPAGTNGTNGNANVISNTYTGNWIFQGGNEWDVTLNVPAITSSIMSKGAVLVYFSGDGGVTWITLPTYVNPVSMIAVIKLSQVGIAAVGGSSAPAGTLFQVVVMSAQRWTNFPKNIDIKNHQAVKEYLHLTN
jgi:hypothetical protein